MVGRGDGLGETVLPVHDGDQDIVDPTIAQFVHHRQPELGTLVVGNPESQNLAFLVAGDAERDVNGLVFDHSTVGIANFHPQCVKDHNGIHPVQRPVLPFANLMQHGIGDVVDQIRRCPQAVKLLQMGLNVADRQTRRGLER